MTTASDDATPTPTPTAAARTPHQTIIPAAASGSGRFVKQGEWAGKPSGNWCLGPSTGDAYAWVWGIKPKNATVRKSMQSGAFFVRKWFAMPSTMRSSTP